VNVTEVNVKLVNGGKGKLLAFAVVVLDGVFLVRDLKVINTLHGRRVVMPSRKIADRCNLCTCRNPLQARFCNGCGVELGEADVDYDERGKPVHHVDVAYPMDQSLRRQIEDRVMCAYLDKVGLLNQRSGTNGTRFDAGVMP